MAELEKALHTQITKLCADGDKEAARGEYKAAIAEYNKAWKLIPEPKNDWEASTWILAAIGDVCFLGGFYDSAKKALRYAMTCPDAVGNPFLHLRLGQVQFETQDLDASADEFYMGGGDEIFASEDAKYLAFLKTRAKI